MAELRWNPDDPGLGDNCFAPSDRPNMPKDYVLSVPERTRRYLKIMTFTIII